jgi:hypothetical protein
MKNIFVFLLTFVFFKNALPASFFVGAGVGGLTNQVKREGRIWVLNKQVSEKQTSYGDFFVEAGFVSHLSSKFSIVVDAFGEYNSFKNKQELHRLGSINENTIYYKTFYTLKSDYIFGFRLKPTYNITARANVYGILGLGIDRLSFDMVVRGFWSFLNLPQDLTVYKNIGFVKFGIGFESVWIKNVRAFIEAEYNTPLNKLDNIIYFNGDSIFPNHQFSTNPNKISYKSFGLKIGLRYIFL